MKDGFKYSNVHRDHPPCRLTREPLHHHLHCFNPTFNYPCNLFPLMITKKVIDTLYKKYRSRPDSPDELNIGLLFDYVFENHGLIINENELIINSVDPSSPFHAIPLRHIHEIVEFGEDIAIVLHSSIIFLKKEDNRVNIHVKTPVMSPVERLRNAIGI